MVTGGILPTGSVLLNGTALSLLLESLSFSNSWIGAKKTLQTTSPTLFSLWPPPHVWVGHLWITAVSSIKENIQAGNGGESVPGPFPNEQT